MSSLFSEFNLADSLQQALADLEFANATEVQAAAIPLALEGRDLLVSSQTGSGKTFAFLLPSINPLALNALDPNAPRTYKNIPAPTILVLCPTRELAQQVSQDAIKLVRHIKGVRIASIMGGMPFGKQIAQLKGAQIVVATPGRLLDLVNRRQISLSDVEVLILDEADRMLDLGFADDLEAISDLARNRKQTLMFSATFANRVISLAEKMTNQPERIAIASEHTTNTDIQQTLHWADGFEHKKKLLTHWLKDTTMDQAVVFASTQQDTDMLAEDLAAEGFEVVALHGAMPQAVRNRRLKTLRDGRAKILVATDVAARGLDVPTISHVINFGLPMKNEDYVHRIGRTGRAGRSGQAITLATHRERSKIRSLEDYLNARLTVGVIEGLEPSPPPAGGGAGRRTGSGGPGRNSGGGYGGGRRVEGERNFRDQSSSERPPRRYEGDSARPAREGAPSRDGYAARPRREGSENRGGYSRDAGAQREGGYNREASAPREGSYTRDSNSAPRDGAAREGGYRGQRDATARPESAGYRSERPRFSDDNRGNRAERPARSDSAPRSGGYADRRSTESRAPRRDDSAGYNTAAPAREQRPRRPDGERRTKWTAEE